MSVSMERMQQIHTYALWKDPVAVDARFRLKGISEMLFAIAEYGSDNDALEANRKIHMPRISRELDKILDEVCGYAEEK